MTQCAGSETGLASTTGYSTTTAEQRQPGGAGVRLHRLETAAAHLPARENTAAGRLRRVVPQAVRESAGSAAGAHEVHLAAVGALLPIPVQAESTPPVLGHRPHSPPGWVSVKQIGASHPPTPDDAMRPIRDRFGEHDGIFDDHDCGLVAAADRRHPRGRRLNHPAGSRTFPCRWR